MTWRRGSRAARAARRLDRRVYLSHPWVYLASVVLARVPVLKLGRTVVVNDADLVREALTQVRLDRWAAGTTGGAIQAQLDASALFNEDGDGHRRSRRRVASALSAAGVEALRPVWTRHLDDAVAELAAGREVDVVRLSRLVAGDTTRALLGVAAQASVLCAAATAVAAQAAGSHLRIAARPGAREHDLDAGRLTDLLRPSGAGLLTELSDDGLTADEVLAVGATLAVAAVNTTLAAIPRAVALVARAGLVVRRRRLRRNGSGCNGSWPHRVWPHRVWPHRVWPPSCCG